jgi:hypothetical protein
MFVGRWVYIGGCSIKPDFIPAHEQTALVLAGLRVPIIGVALP